MNFNANRLKAERIARGFSQEELAKELSWTRSVYTKRENGSVPIGADDLAEVATVLGIKPEDMGIFFTLEVPERQHQC